MGGDWGTPSAWAAAARVCRGEGSEVRDKRGEGSEAREARRWKRGGGSEATGAMLKQS